VVKKSKRAAKVFGKQVRLFRRQKRWSQEKLAAEAGIDKAYLGRVERGETNIGIENIAKIAESLGIEIANLFRVEHRTGRPRAHSGTPGN
jgi:transcriptional regulator with XRE-family HTH domain